MTAKHDENEAQTTIGKTEEVSPNDGLIGRLAHGPMTDPEERKRAYARLKEVMGEATPKDAKLIPPANMRYANSITLEGKKYVLEEDSLAAKQALAVLSKQLGDENVWLRRRLTIAGYAFCALFIVNAICGIVEWFTH